MISRKDKTLRDNDGENSKVFNGNNQSTINTSQLMMGVLALKLHEQAILWTFAANDGSLVSPLSENATFGGRIILNHCTKTLLSISVQHFPIICGSSAVWFLVLTLWLSLLNYEIPAVGLTKVILTIPLRFRVVDRAEYSRVSRNFSHVWRLRETTIENLRYLNLLSK